MTAPPTPGLLRRALDQPPLSVVRTYLLPWSPPLRGSLHQATAPSGMRYGFYLPEGYSRSTERFGVLYHLPGAGMRWSWAIQEACPAPSSRTAGRSRQARSSRFWTRRR